MRSRARERKQRHESKEGGGVKKEELEGFAWMRKGGGITESVDCRGCGKDVAAVAEVEADLWSPV